RRHAHHRIQFSPGLGSVLGKRFERRIIEQTPELIHPADEFAAIEESADQVEEVERDGRAGESVVQKLRNIDPEERSSCELVSERLPRTKLRSQVFRNSTFGGVSGSRSGLKPVGTPFLSGRYVPLSARTRISSPRSLSKTTCVTFRRARRLNKKPIKTDLPEPVGPQMKVWPVSFRLPPSGSLGSLAWSEK